MVEEFECKIYEYTTLYATYKKMGFICHSYSSKSACLQKRFPLCEYYTDLWQEYFVYVYSFFEY